MPVIYTSDTRNSEVNNVGHDQTYLSTGDITYHIYHIHYPIGWIENNRARKLTVSRLMVASRLTYLRM